MDRPIGNKANILIVDDDVLIGDSTRFQLKKAQYKAVGIASNAQEAIEMAKDKHPDLILMDINLGSSDDGVFAAHEIQKFADIPFIFLTAYSDSITVDRVKKISPYGYLIKPYDNRELLVAIETTLYKHVYDKKIKEQELMFRTIANFAYEWEFWILPDLSFKYCSPSCERVTGYSAEEFIANPKLLFDIVHPQDKSEFEKHFDEYYSCKREVIVKTYEFRILNRNGEIKYIRHTCSPITDEQNNYLGRRVTNVDITEKLTQQNELKKYQEHLEELVEVQTGQIRKQNIFFRTLIDTIPNVIFVEDTEFRFTEVNKSFEDFFGVNRDMVLGKSIAEFVPVEIAKVARQYEEKLIKDHKTVIYESFVPNKDNIMVPVIIYKSSFGIPGKKPDGITAMLIDNSKQKEMERTILDSLRKAKELNEVKTNFISMASHEFRTPLTSILSSADLLELYHTKWDKAKIITHLNRIQNSVQVIASLLDEVLTLNRSEGGKIELNPSLVDLQEFCSEIIDQIKSQMSPNQNIIYDCKLTNTHVAADIQILNHIINNLLINAVKYSPEGGDVLLTVEEDDEFLIFTVLDNGIGIPEEDQKNLFEPFFRAKNSSGIKGTGLGLTIIKRYVEIHKGEISFESKLGEGTKFIIKIKKLIVKN